MKTFTGFIPLNISDISAPRRRVKSRLVVHSNNNINNNNIDECDWMLKFLTAFSFLFIYKKLNLLTV